jgi:peptidoglycan-N-acetylglucosamine deacetylase
LYLVKTPPLVQNLFPRFTWRMNKNVATPQQQKVLYLTFDDGPIPEVTPWVLQQLARYNAKATFFCVGENVCKNTQIFNDVLNAGHSVGNHTYNHRNGWTTPLNDYLDNVAQCAAFVSSNLFRPPYGRLSPKQSQALHQEYNIVMWDVLSGDFDANLSPINCLQNVIKHTQAGSILLFHDSIKASRNLFYALPRVLAHFSELGYVFQALPMQNTTAQNSLIGTNAVALAV